MIIKYLGHATFVIITDSGTKILTDPYDTAYNPETLKFSKIEEEVDVVTVSHGHRDHSAFVELPGAPVIIRGNGKFLASGVEFFGVETYHDDVRGEQKGRNTVYVICTDGLRVAHMGDLGHVLTADQAADIGAVDVVLLPVGGYYTIDPEQAAKVADQLEARIIVPMHYRNEKCLFPIVGVDAFLQGKKNVTMQNGPELPVGKDSLPDDQQIVVLNPAL